MLLLLAGGEERWYFGQDGSSLSMKPAVCMNYLRSSRSSSPPQDLHGVTKNRREQEEEEPSTSRQPAASLTCTAGMPDATRGHCLTNRIPD